VKDVNAILLNQNVKIIPCHHETVLDAIKLYGSRSDKGYSLTDCISMIVMKELGIIQILTHDEYFTQEGFEILL
jgi:predicted nucleic acid-binding protein